MIEGNELAIVLMIVGGWLLIKVLIIAFGMYVLDRCQYGE